MGQLEDCIERSYSAAFIRIFDGNRWYYAATTETGAVQSEIDNLAVMTSPTAHIDDHPVVQLFEHHQGAFRKFEENNLSKISVRRKLDLLKGYFPTVEANKFITSWAALYLDCATVKKLYSSKGTNLVFDSQQCGFMVSFIMADGKKTFSESYKQAASNFDDLPGGTDELDRKIVSCQDFMLQAEPVEPGIYPVILSPLAAGVFAHESFGHKSEADFMIGDETMKKEWAIGTRVGASLLTIVDDGSLEGSGYCPFDDEGTRARKTKLVENGILAGRLHSCQTAADLDEEPTGNARAISFEFQPIVRMSTTYIEPGTLTRDQLFAGVEDGYFIDTLSYGSGMSTFTIAPLLAYRIRNGRIAEPVKISVISGTVFETLGEIDGLSDRLEIQSFVGGGCGKMEQNPLPVGFGGPYVRIRKMNVQ
jgi:TldD protein